MYNLWRNCWLGAINSKSPGRIVHKTSGIVFSIERQSIGKKLEVMLLSCLNVVEMDCDILVPIWSALHMVHSKCVNEFMLDGSWRHASAWLQIQWLLASSLTNARPTTCVLPSDSDIVGVRRLSCSERNYKIWNDSCILDVPCSLPDSHTSRQLGIEVSNCAVNQGPVGGSDFRGKVEWKFLVGPTVEWSLDSLTLPKGSLFFFRSKVPLELFFTQYHVIQLIVSISIRFIPLAIRSGNQEWIVLDWWIFIRPFRQGWRSFILAQSKTKDNWWQKQSKLDEKKFDSDHKRRIFE